MVSTAKMRSAILSQPKSFPLPSLSSDAPVNSLTDIPALYALSFDNTNTTGRLGLIRPNEDSNTVKNSIARFFSCFSDFQVFVGGFVEVIDKNAEIASKAVIHIEGISWLEDERSIQVSGVYSRRYGGRVEGSSPVRFSIKDSECQNARVISGTTRVLSVDRHNGRRAESPEVTLYFFHPKSE